MGSPEPDRGTRIAHEEPSCQTRPSHCHRRQARARLGSPRPSPRRDRDGARRTTPAGRSSTPSRRPVDKPRRAAAAQARHVPSPPRRPRPAARPAAGQPARSGSSNRVRARLARLGVQRSNPYNPVLEPLLRIVRSNDPKIETSTLRQIERAYQVAERWHRGQKRKSGDPYITHPLAVTTILAELGMDPATLMAGLLHDTVEDTEYGLDQLRRDFGDSGRPARRRRHQAGQGQVRRGRAGRDRAQDGRRHGQGPARPGHQARRPAAQHAHHALPQAGEAGEEGPRDPGDLRAAGPPAGHEHHQVGAGGPRLRDPLPQDVRRDRPAGRRARAQARRVPGHSDRRGPVRPARRPHQGHRHRPARSTTTASTRR